MHPSGNTKPGTNFRRRRIAEVKTVPSCKPCNGERWLDDLVVCFNRISVSRQYYLHEVGGDRVSFCSQRRFPYPHRIRRILENPIRSPFMIAPFQCAGALACKATGDRVYSAELFVLRDFLRDCWRIPRYMKAGLQPVRHGTRRL